MRPLAFLTPPLHVVISVCNIFLSLVSEKKKKVLIKLTQMFDHFPKKSEGPLFRLSARFFFPGGGATVFCCLSEPFVSLLYLAAVPSQMQLFKPTQMIPSHHSYDNTLKSTPPPTRPPTAVQRKSFFLHKKKKTVSMNHRGDQGGGILCFPSLSNPPP